MCEQQFDFVCAHIARLKQTERKKERNGERIKHWLSVVTLPTEFV